jgi:hypothetical protein
LLVWSGRRMMPWHRAYLGEQSLGEMR